MAAPTTAGELVSLLEQSGLVTTALLTRLRSQVRGGTSQALAQTLINQGILTPFQVKQLLLGRFRGLLLGPYRLLDELGTGGMGAVYLAEHVDLRRQVAVKVLSPEKAKEQVTVERFLREARAAAALDHPNIVRAIDVHRDKNVLYLVLEYVDGVNVSQLLKQVGRVPIGYAAHFVRQAALGLHYAHEHGVVHRDIKPGNLMVKDDGQLKILDMGLARFAQSPADELTRNFEGTAVMGTADYISPEQALDSTDVDFRADIYSLGATFFTLLAGQPPFSEGTLAQKLMMHQLTPAPRLDEVRPGVPGGLVDLVAMMLEKSPEERPPSAAWVAEALEEWARVPPGNWLPSLGLREQPSATKPLPALTIREKRPLTPEPAEEVAEAPRAKVPVRAKEPARAKAGPRSVKVVRPKAASSGRWASLQINGWVAGSILGIIVLIAAVVVGLQLFTTGEPNEELLPSTPVSTGRR